MIRTYGVISPLKLKGIRRLVGEPLDLDDSDYQALSLEGKACLSLMSKADAQKAREQRLAADVEMTDQRLSAAGTTVKELEEQRMQVLRDFESRIETAKIDEAHAAELLGAAKSALKSFQKGGKGDKQS